MLKTVFSDECEKRSITYYKLLAFFHIITFLSSVHCLSFRMHNSQTPLDGITD